MMDVLMDVLIRVPTGLPCGTNLVWVPTGWPCNVGSKQKPCMNLFLGLQTDYPKLRIPSVPNGLPETMFSFVSKRITRRHIFLGFQSDYPKLRFRWVPNGLPKATFSIRIAPLNTCKNWKCLERFSIPTGILKLAK